MVQYPEVLDLEAISTLVNIVKNRQLVERKKEFGIAAWNVQGYLQRIFIGVPLDNQVGAFYAHSGDIQDGLEELQDVLATYESSKQEYSASNPEEAQDIGTVILIVSTILNLLRSLGFIKERRTTTRFGVSGPEVFPYGVEAAEADEQDYDDEDFDAEAPN